MSHSNITCVPWAQLGYGCLPCMNMYESNDDPMTGASETAHCSGVRPKGAEDWHHTFTVPRNFSARTMAALKSGDKMTITGAVRSEIVSALATLIMVHTSYPTPEQYTTVCQKLVEEFNILQDGFRCGYVSHYFNTHYII